MTEVVPHRCLVFNLHTDVDLCFSGPCGQFHSPGAFAAPGQLKAGAGAPEGSTSPDEVLGEGESLRVS